MLSRRTFAMIGATLLSPFIAQMPADVEPEPKITLGPLLEGHAFLIVGTAAGVAHPWGEIHCRKVNGVWLMHPASELRAKLDAVEAHEIAALEAAGLPSVEVV